MTDFPPCSLWDYSVALYGRDGVAEACLLLQERHQLDVNLVLYCIWAASTGAGALDREEMATVCRAAAEWHVRVVRHLRSLRQGLKEPIGPAPQELAQALRRQVAKSELDAEHIEQLVLAATLERPPGDKDNDERLALDAVRNLARYFAWLGIDPDAEDRAKAGVLLGAAFPALAPGRLELLAKELARIEY